MALIARLADLGVPLPEARAALDTAAAVGLAGLLAELRRLGYEAGACDRAAVLATGFVRNLDALISAGHAAGLRERLGPAGRTALLAGLLCGRTPVEVDPSGALGVVPPFGLLVISNPDLAASELDSAAQALAAGSPGALGGAGVPAPAHRVLLAFGVGSGWPALVAAAGERAARLGVSVIAAGPLADPAALAEAYRSAVGDLGFAGLAAGGAGLADPRRLAVFRALAGGAGASRGLNAALFDRPEMPSSWTQTFDAFLRHGSSTAAVAAALGISRQSLHRRVRRIEAASGLDLGAEFDRFACELACQLQALATSTASALPETRD
ncbi:MAG: helix-turn-helix domain-containing protein [Mycobacteriales bacterium]